MPVLVAFLFIINVINVINAYDFFIEEKYQDALLCSLGVVAGVGVYTALILENV